MWTKESANRLRGCDAHSCQLLAFKAIKEFLAKLNWCSGNPRPPLSSKDLLRKSVVTRTCAQLLSSHSAQTAGKYWSTALLKVTFFSTGLESHQHQCVCSYQLHCTKNHLFPSALLTRRNFQLVKMSQLSCTEAQLSKSFICARRNGHTQEFGQTKLVYQVHAGLCATVPAFLKEDSPLTHGGTVTWLKSLIA